MAALTSAADGAGFVSPWYCSKYCRTSAAAPAVSGVAMLVPPL
jgi:hypothetical protein